MPSKSAIRRRKRTRTVYPPKPGENQLAVIDRVKANADWERAAYGETVGVRVRIHDVPEAFAKTAECGHSVGRLLNTYVRNKAMTRQEEADLLGAASRFHEIVAAYDKDILGSPNPNPRAIDMNAVGGRSVKYLDRDAERAITNRYMVLVGVLDTLADRQSVMRVMRLAIIEDADTSNWPALQVNRLLKGLRCVADMG